jgi:hypothetical protein
MLELQLLTALIIKHFLADFPLQTPYQYKNKHIFAHPGGILHASIHGALTWLVLGLLISFTDKYILILVISEIIIHYTIDWGKQNINLKFNLTTNSKYFWWFLGLDQLLHYLTYIGIAYLCLIKLN